MVGGGGGRWEAEGDEGKFEGSQWRQMSCARHVGVRDTSGKSLAIKQLPQKKPEFPDVCGHMSHIVLAV